MDFGAALTALKEGTPVRRPYWAPGAFLTLVPGSTFTVQAERPLGIAVPDLVGADASYVAHLDLCSSQDGKPILWPWPKPDGDLLADDWELAP